MSGDEEELIQRHLDGCATPEESSALQQALKESSELRARYLDYVNLDVALSALADATAVEEGTITEMPVAQSSHFRWRAFAAAAACLASVCIAGLLTHRKHSPARVDGARAIAVFPGPGGETGLRAARGRQRAVPGFRRAAFDQPVFGTGPGTPAARLYGAAV